MSQTRRVFSREEKEQAVKELLEGKSIRAVAQERQIHRSMLYRWRDRYYRQGAVGLRPVGPVPLRYRQPPAGSVEEAAQQRVAELERKIGRQALEIDFLQRAFKRVKESRQQSTSSGVTASTRKSDA